MRLSAGTRVGRYEIVSALGAGGMGEVYRARDAELGRDVALKILKDAFTDDPERVARFTREAKVLASLNHPHIAAIYGVETGAAARALVLELVEGPTLADRIGSGRIAIEEALPIARQIAEALEAAHEQGIVHRDLKPANVKVRADGTVKVLDFGLAKAMDPVSSSPDGTVDPATSPTFTAGTRVGVVLGTAAYMSPEQARGRPVDRRGDIWAFGCVLYEMLTGVRAFPGEDVSDSIAAILRAEPDWRRLPQETPAAVRRLLRRCLEKDPKQRLPHIGMARLEIDEAAAAPPELTTASVVPRHRWSRLPWIVSGVSLAIAGAVLVLALWRGNAEPEPLRLEIVPPAGFAPESLTVSPDGRQVAFVAPSDGVPRVWVRRFDQAAAQPLRGTEEASYPFWAPDGRALGFYARGKLQRIDISGGTPQVLADAPAGRGASWSRDGVIVFSSAIDGTLMRVPATGGTPAIATKLAAKQRSHRWPHFLPDGRQFLYLVFGEPDVQGIYVASVDSDRTERVVDATAAGSYGSGHLVFQRGNTLHAVSFDARRAKLSGDQMTLLQNVFRTGIGRTAFSLSSNGLFAYVQGTFGRRQLAWVDRTGKTVATVGPPDEDAPANPELAPDGRRVALTRSSESPDVWLIDVARGVPSRLTFGSGNFHAPIWSFDSRTVLFRSQQGGAQNLVVKPADGIDEARSLLTSGTNKTPSDWSPDGSIVLYMVPGDDLMALDVRTNKSFPVVRTSANEGWGQFSPDGRFVAYQSDESGRFEVYIRTFPENVGKWVVSVAGGTQPRWRRDGTELYYVAPDEYLMAVRVSKATTGRIIDVHAPQRLFRANLPAANARGVLSVFSGPKQQYAVAADGRFLMPVPLPDPSGPPPVSVVVNWPALMKQ